MRTNIGVQCVLSFSTSTWIEEFSQFYDSPHSPIGQMFAMHHPFHDFCENREIPLFRSRSKPEFPKERNDAFGKHPIVPHFVVRDPISSRPNGAGAEHSLEKDEI